MKTLIGHCGTFKLRAIGIKSLQDFFRKVNTEDLVQSTVAVYIIQAGQIRIRISLAKELHRL